MMKHALLLTTALVVSSSVAVAAGRQAPTLNLSKIHAPKGVTLVQGPHGGLLGERHGTFGPGHVSPNLGAGLSDLRSTEKNARYISWYSYFTGCFSGGLYCYKEAEAFVPGVSATSKKVTLGMAAFDSTCTYYTCNATISINADNGGVPGAALASKNVTVTNQWGPCCVDTVAKLAVALTAGTRYWIVAQGKTTSDLLLWHIQDDDFVNPNLTAYDFSYNGNDYGWFSYSTSTSFDIGKNYQVN